MSKKYDKLLYKYGKTVDDLYGFNLHTYGNIADMLSYDYEGFRDKDYVFDIFEEEEAIEKLSQAVDRASIMLKFCNHKYQNTFG